MTVLGIDYGEKRIGLAISDVGDTIATPLENYRRRTPEDDLSYIGEIAEKNDVDTIVVGLPLNMDGSEGPSAASARLFADKVIECTALRVEMFDERLSTVSASEAMIGAGLSRSARKKRLDKVAAQIFLQAYLDSRKLGQSLT